MLIGGNKSYIGKIVAREVAKDLVIVQIFDYKSKSLKLATEFFQGAEVMVYGTPKGYEGSATFGHVSSIRKLKDITVVQIDAAINGGNSGGPVLNKQGQVIGIATIKRTDAEGIGFCVSAYDIKELLAWYEANDTETYDREIDSGLSEDEEENSDNFLTTIFKSIVCGFAFVLSFCLTILTVGLDLIIKFCELIINYFYTCSLKWFLLTKLLWSFTGKTLIYNWYYQQATLLSFIISIFTFGLAFILTSHKLDSIE